MRPYAILLATALAGCAGQASVGPPAAAIAPVTCATAADCAAKWSRAAAWIAQNSGYKVKTQSDIMIQTEGPTDSSAIAAFTVTRVANAAGGAAISLDGGCDNFLGCVPTMGQSRASFAAFVNSR
jgi:hypothetical protein